MKGIDVSKYQGVIDFKKVKSDGVQIVYIKATEGKTYKDPMTIINYTKAKLAGLKVGFYHFLRNNDPIDEAKAFLDYVHDLPADCIHIIDVENDYNQGRIITSKNVRGFVKYLKTQKLESGIYTGDSFYSNMLDNTVKTLPLWIAHYGVQNPNVSKWAGFQYSDKGKIAGISGNVDMNIFNDSILITPSDILQIKALGLIKHGMTGNRVKDLQLMLHNKGYVLVIDGIFGARTLQVVKSFQSSNKLIVDGIVGPATAHALQ